VAVTGSDFARGTLANLQQGWQLRLGVATLLYLTILQERILSKEGGKKWRYIVLFCLLVASLFLFLIGPLKFQAALHPALVAPFSIDISLEGDQ